MTQIGGLEWLEDLQLHPYPTGPTANISSLNITELSAVKMAHFKTSQRACMPLGSLPIAFLHHASAHGKHPTTQHCPKCSGMLWHALACSGIPWTVGDNGNNPLHHLYKLTVVELEYIPGSLPINHHKGTEKLPNSEVRSISNWGSARICWS